MVSLLRSLSISNISTLIFYQMASLQKSLAEKFVMKSLHVAIPLAETTCTSYPYQVEDLIKKKIRPVRGL